jgi:hypothetical protein
MLDFFAKIKYHNLRYENATNCAKSNKEVVLDGKKEVKKKGFTH